MDVSVRLAVGVGGGGEEGGCYMPRTQHNCVPALKIRFTISD